jgi:hypothetical protein
MNDHLKGKSLPDQACDAGGDDPALDERIQRQLGAKLKALYDEVARQPIPDRFRKLLEDLERKEKNAGAGDGS